jgi:formate dehydrogenase maturation protein FdhE
MKIQKAKKKELNELNNVQFREYLNEFIQAAEQADTAGMEKALEKLNKNNSSKQITDNIEKIQFAVLLGDYSAAKNIAGALLNKT